MVSVWRRVDILLKKKGYRVFTQLPYLVQRRLYHILSRSIPVFFNRGRGENYVVGSWEEMAEMDDFTNLRRVHRHVWVGPKLRGKRVLDIGCGCGYGTYYMSHFAKEIVGIDYDPGNIEWASEHFKRPNLKFVKMNALKIRFPPGSFDVVTCFEVIEHFPEKDQDVVINNIKSTCKDVVYMTTPNSGPLCVRTRELRMYGTYGKEKYHRREMSVEEFDELLARHFDNYIILGQHVKGVSTFEDWLRVRGRKLSIEDFEMVKTDFNVCANIMVVCKVGKKDRSVMERCV